MSAIHLVAEVSGNHGGSLGNALKLVEAAAAAGATAVKTQYFDPDALTKKRIMNPRIMLTKVGENDLLKLYRSTHTPVSWLPQIRDCANELHMEWYSSVFDPEHIPALVALRATKIKISSFEYRDVALIKAAVHSRLPIIISIPLGSAISPTFRFVNNYSIGNGADRKVTYLLATPYGMTSISRIETFWKLGYQRINGLSDHSTDLKTSLHFADSLFRDGATMLERHIRLDGIDTPDKEFSSTGEELKQIFDAARKAAEATA